MQTVACSREYVPGPHSLHDEDLTSVENVPAAQIEQLLAFDAENMPISHGSHEDDAALPLNAPAGHTVQLFGSVAPVDERYEPAKHDWHDVLPSIVAKVPSSHIEQTDDPFVSE